MKYTFVDTKSSFENAIAIISNSPIIGIDTEFVRRTSYFPMLSLIQIATESQECFVFDIQSKDIKWDSLLNILSDDKIQKIIHSAEQDLEAVYYKFNIIISNIIDTQIIAKTLEMTAQCGYGGLVEKYLGISINKEKQFSAWEIRPLSDVQLEYAATDALYLVPIYKKMLSELIDKEINIEDISNLCNAISFKTQKPDKLSIKKKVNAFCLKFHIPQTDKILVYNMMLFREKMAIKHNLVRKFILEDTDILNIVKHKKPFGKSRYVSYQAISDIITQSSDI